MSDPYYQVSVKLNKKVYQSGDEMIIRVKATKPSYISVLNFAADGSVILLYPNRLRKNNYVKALKQYMTHTKNPVCVITVDKKKSQQKLIKKLEVLKSHIKVLIIVDTINNDIEDPYMLIWRVVNNIDASRDVVLEPFIALDATNKSEVDGFTREWPGDTFCTKEVLDMLQEKGLIDIDEAFIRKFGLLPYNASMKENI